ncbi:transposase [Bacillus salacetis]|uniref:Transposase n=1 Tax=Bacillus salacetis TaxID=2315464 RepID=A0A3A1QT15_9BACI|nr:LXG domain-containing protein [Bacillus salacetis]RIW29379.1 transposase [Bacillus salacetis]
MKVLKALPFHEGIKSQQENLKRLQGEIEAILEAIESFSRMEESLKGKGGSAIRAFYRDCHVPFLEFFLTFRDKFNIMLDQMLSALNSLEPHSSGVIREDFLEGEIQSKLNEVRQLTASLTDEGNAIIRSVSDIVMIPKLNDENFQDSVWRAVKKKDDTITDLHQFDRSQTTAMDMIADDIETMEQWLSDLEGMIKDGLVNNNFPTKQWKEYISVSPLTTELAKRNGEEVKEDLRLKQKEDVSSQKRYNAIVSGAITSFRMFRAGRKDGLRIEKVYNPQTGKHSYRMYATERALESFGVLPDRKAKGELMKSLPKNMRKYTEKHKIIAENKVVTLKYASKKPGQSGWSKVGDDILKEHAPLAYWNNQATNTEKLKTVGKAAISGAGKSFKDAVDFKGIATSGPGKSSIKALGPLGAGLTYYSNHHKAVEDGLTGSAAVGRATVDTTIDLAVSGAVQAAFTAAGTAFIPIPGVGTAIGIGAGMFANYLLNKKSEKSGKSVLDNIKGWFR